MANVTTATGAPRRLRLVGRESGRPPTRRFTIIGCGLIGTSIGLALSRAGHRVALSDHDAGSVAEAVRMGAGRPLADGDQPADVVVIATPPSTVARVLRDAQDRGLGAVYTDVASAKARVLADAELAGCDFTTYVPGHPMAGREQSGPRAAHADLFAGRPWALCPHPGNPAEPVDAVTALVDDCGGVVTMLSAEAHDEVVAVVSHAPHLVSAALAARFARADETTLSLIGTGLHDATRIAGGGPGLWCDILEHNADSVATVLEAVVRDLTEAARALRSPDRRASGTLADLLTRGNRGRQHIVARMAA
jgi:prephenate dehydrogenase